MARQKAIIKDALAAAREEGFMEAAKWSEKELLTWYRAYLEYTNQKIPNKLRNIKVDTA